MVLSVVRRTTAQQEVERIRNLALSALAFAKPRNMTTKRANRRKPRTTGVTVAKSSNTRAKRKTATAKKMAFAATQVTATKAPVKAAPAKAKKAAAKAVKK